MQPPEKIQQVSEAQRQSRVWANVATAIASEIPTTTSVDALVSEPTTQAKRKPYAPLSDPNSVRVYHIHPDGKSERVYEGEEISRTRRPLPNLRRSYRQSRRTSTPPAIARYFTRLSIQTHRRSAILTIHRSQNSLCSRF